MRPIVPLLASLLVTSCASGPRVPRAATGPTVNVDGVARTYRVHAPAGGDRTRPRPLLFVFHGAGSDAADIARGSGFDALADADPMLVVYPEARGGRFDLPQGVASSADVRFVDALLADLETRFAVDRRRVFATGFSNGAAFCYRLASERPDLLAAIAPVAGYLPPLGPLADRPPPPVPLLHVHGTADRRVAPPTIGGGPDDAIAAWARRNGATRGPMVGDVPGTAGLPVRRAAWAGATPRSDTVVWLVEGAEHTWPGGPAGPVSRGILDFFRTHPR